ncbi:TPA: PAS domain S-box protein [Candidatus Woesearchaeota archaeon]|nr:PAS domain S-box protein [Candidatus Woesearchaeota archaeon]
MEQKEPPHFVHSDLFDNMQEGYACHRIILNKDNVPVDYEILEANASFEKLTGLKRSEVIGKRATQVFPTLKKEPFNWIHAYGTVAMENKKMKLERYFGPLGKWFSISTYCPEKGYFVTTFHDISERMKAEAALKESENKFKSIFNNSAVAITITDKNERIISWNSFTEDLLGMTKKDLLGRHVSLLYPEEEWVRMRKENIRKKGIKHHYETKIIKKNKKVVDVDISLSVLRDDKGKIKMSIGIIRDITERKISEEAVKKSEEKYRRTFELSPEAIVLLDHKGIVLDANKRLFNILGYRTSDIIGERLLKYPYITRKSETQAMLVSLSTMRGTSARHFEVEFITQKGKRRTGSIWTSMLGEEDGKNIGHVMLISDITEKKKADEKLRKNREELAKKNLKLQAKSKELQITYAKLHEAHRQVKKFNEELENRVKVRTRQLEEEKQRVQRLLQLKTDFVNQLSHDLITPLTPIIALLPLALEDTKDKDTRINLDICIRNAKYLNALIQDTLNLARLDSGTLEFNIARIELKRIIDEIIKDNGPVFEKYNVKAKNTVKERIYCRGDTLRVREIFENLYMNSVKFMPNGGELTFSARKDKEEVHIAVKDTGIGLTKSQAEKVFDEFYKVDPSRHEMGSSGLGLSICRRIVEKLGGTIRIESHGLQKGTTVTFTLPQRKKKVKSNAKKDSDC